MKNLQTYLAESAKTYEFRLKSAAELSDDQLDKLERHLRKYEAFDVSTPTRTILQSAPLDFHNIGASEIFIIDFKTKLPMSPALALAELVQCMGVSERVLRLRGIDEPGEILDQESMENKDDKKVDSKLLDGEYSDHENADAADYYGEKHLTKFIKELQDSKRDHNTEYKVK